MANGMGLLGASFVERNLLALPASLLVWTAQAVETRVPVATARMAAVWTL